MTFKITQGHRKFDGTCQPREGGPGGSGTPPNPIPLKIIKDKTRTDTRMHCALG